eukprot:jgi/Bigna1/134425/aug1.25_g9133
MYFILLAALATLAPTTEAKACKTLDSINLDKYVGRWYNIYYDKFDTLFSTQECSSAYYVKVNETFITVNNSGTVPDKKGNLFYTGFVSLVDASRPAEFTLHLDGVPMDATYYICDVGADTYADYYYEYSIVTDKSGFSLYVLARDVDQFGEKFDQEVQEKLKALGYSGIIWGPMKNNQTSCPDFEPHWKPNPPQK